MHSTASSSLITSDGAVIPYRIRGRGPPLILIHGWSQSGAMFRHQLEGLSTVCKVIVPDLRGHGESPNPRGGLRMSRLAKDLLELMEHLGLQQASLLGWSMGASVIWSFIDLFGTQRIDKLILVDQPAMLTQLPGMSEEEITQCGALFTWSLIEELRSGLLSSSGSELRAGFVRTMVTKNISKELLQWILDENAKTSTEVAAALLWSHCTQDWRDVLGRIDRPTLVIAGEVSHVNQLSQHYIHSRIANSRLRVFSEPEGGGHFMFLEDPLSFNRALTQFLADVS